MIRHPIAHLAFDLAQVERRDRLELWRQHLSPTFDAMPLDAAGDLEGRIELYHLGPMLAGGIDFQDHRFGRDKARVSASGVDHFMLKLFDQGGYDGLTGKQDIRVRPGDVEVLHLGQTLHTQATASRTFGLVIPKDLLDQRVRGGAALHGLVLRREQAAGALLADFLRSLRRTLPAAEMADAPVIVESCVNMVTACLRPTADAIAQAQPAIHATLRERILAHIDIHLDDAALGADSLCRDFRLSRSYLYRLFEPQGGVAAQIRERRLRRAMALLAAPDNRRWRICDIAYACGFSEERTFARLFRSRFGMAPSEARDGLPPSMPGGDRPLAAEWMLALGKAGG